jgi:hypothetical protein
MKLNYDVQVHVASSSFYLMYSSRGLRDSCEGETNS